MKDYKIEFKYIDDKKIIEDYTNIDKTELIIQFNREIEVLLKLLLMINLGDSEVLWNTLKLQLLGLFREMLSKLYDFNYEKATKLFEFWKNLPFYSASSFRIKNK